MVSDGSREGPREAYMVGTRKRKNERKPLTDEQLVERLMRTNSIPRDEAVTRVRRLKKSVREGRKLLRERGAIEAAPAAPKPVAEKLAIGVHSHKRPKRKPSWSRATKVFLRGTTTDRMMNGSFQGSDGIIYSQHMLTQNVELGSMKIVSSRRTKTGRTITVLKRRI